MQLLKLPQTYFIFFFLFLLSSCVSKKKHIEALQKTTATHQAELQDKTIYWTGALQECRDSNINLRLNVAERKGENNALVAMQDKLEGKIEDLKQQMKNQGLKSQTTSQSLSQELASLKQEVSRLQNLLSQVDAKLEKDLTTLGTLANDLRIALGTLPTDQYTINTSNLHVKVIVSESLLFKAKTTTSITTRSQQVLGGIANTLQKYPSMNVMVLGHTDNKPPRNKGYKDNWTVSAVRAALISRLLTEDHGLGSNQVLAAGKGEFAPRASNETREGQGQNRRIEFIIQTRQEDLTRALQKITKEK